ncbi:MAG TPA: hypothetical protein PLN56_03430 [Methanoregulaceae archaeon]|nr:hypothetical protein [Methanoregulaceae archaeon]HPD10035.1 hypothetical protein [Methanoregulaceae archaeon]HRT15041.1 hypothetical protein [Methanoregulaceae archaeon]HRU30612.1 hypothetical protein [Methanoregulaceae archaeon]
MDEEKIRSVFEKEGIGKEITCPQAFTISEKYGIAKMDISRYCNRNSVKIRGCQLGCFR